MRYWVVGLLLVGCGPLEVPPDDDVETPFAIRVLLAEPGEGAGFGAEGMPEIVLGGPRGGGSNAGSLDVFSLGVGGVLELELGKLAIDDEGPDLIVFENAFKVAGSDLAFTEPCEVSVAPPGGDFVPFACDPSAEAPNGCAGFAPVLANVDDNDVDATDPAVSGGDLFDLAELGLDAVDRVRIRDVSEEGAAPSAGCDIDAVAVVH